MKKNLKKSGSIFLLCLIIFNIEAQSVFNIKHNNGISKAMSLHEIQRLEFQPANQTMKVYKTNNQFETFLLSEIRYVNFSTETNTDIHFIQSEKTDGDVFLYPNPILNELNIKFPNSVKSTLFIEIVSIDGKIVFQNKCTSVENELQLNLSKLQKGTYICRIINGTNIQNYKLFKL